MCGKMLEWIMRRFHRVVYTEARARTIMTRAQKALDALEREGEDGINTARSYLYDLLFLLK